MTPPSAGNRRRFYPIRYLIRKVGTPTILWSVSDLWSAFRITLAPEAAGDAPPESCLGGSCCVGREYLRVVALPCVGLVPAPIDSLSEQAIDTRLISGVPR